MESGGRVMPTKCTKEILYMCFICMGGQVAHIYFTEWIIIIIQAVGVLLVVDRRRVCGGLLTDRPHHHA
jgi:hypothetical protein